MQSRQSHQSNHSHHEIRKKSTYTLYSIVATITDIVILSPSQATLWYHEMPQNGTTSHKPVLPVKNRYYQSKAGTTSQKPVLPVTNRYYQSQTGTTKHYIPSDRYHRKILLLPPRRLHHDNRDADENHFRDTRVYAIHGIHLTVMLLSSRGHAVTKAFTPTVATPRPGKQITYHMTMNGPRPKRYMSERNLHAWLPFLYFLFPEFVRIWLGPQWDEHNFCIKQFNLCIPKEPWRVPSYRIGSTNMGYDIYPTLSGIKLATCLVLVPSVRRFH